MCKNSARSCRYPKESDRCWVSTKVLNISLHPAKSCNLVQVRPVPAGVLVPSAARRAEPPSATVTTHQRQSLQSVLSAKWPTAPQGHTSAPDSPLLSVHPCTGGSLAFDLPEFLLYTPEDGSKGQNKHPVQHQISQIYSPLIAGYDLLSCTHMTMQMEYTGISQRSEILMSVNYVHLNHCNSGKLI